MFGQISVPVSHWLFSYLLCDRTLSSESKDYAVLKTSLCTLLEGCERMFIIIEEQHLYLVGTKYWLSSMITLKETRTSANQDDEHPPTLSPGYFPQKMRGAGKPLPFLRGKAPGRGWRILITQFQMRDCLSPPPSAPIKSSYIFKIKKERNLSIHGQLSFSFHGLNKKALSKAVL